MSHPHSNNTRYANSACNQDNELRVYLQNGQIPEFTQLENLAYFPELADVYHPQYLLNLCLFPSGFPFLMETLTLANNKVHQK